MKTASLLFLACFLLPIASARADEDAAGAPAASAFVKTATVEQKSIAVTVTVYGTVQPDPAEVHNISMPREGIISKVFVRPGQTVTAGEPVIGIESSPGAAAQYDQARVALDYAQKDLDRNKKLLQEQLATRDQVAAAEKTLSTAQSELDRMVKTGADKASEVIRATFDGVVTDVTAKPGDRLAADALTMTVASKDALIVALGIEPGDVSRITPDTTVQLSSPVNAGLHIDGKIAAMHGIVNPSTHLVDGLVRLNTADTPGLMPGMTLKGAVSIPVAQSAVVPRAAVMQDEEGAFVYTVVENTAHKMPVTIRAENDAQSALVEALAAGTRVVVGGNAALEDGIKVREEENAGAAEKADAP